ncbi:MAG: bifunctional DNA primase/polymerase, partial [Thermoplasmataceae archaeon]
MSKSNNACDNITNRYSISELKKFLNTLKKPSQQALAIEFSKMGLKVFPCDVDKNPIVDFPMGYSHGFKDATINLKLIARTWHKYPEAGIGLALPEDLIVIDCDVLKDSEKKPILKDGNPDRIGLK